MSKSMRFILAIAAQIAVIFVIIVFKLSVLTGGTEVLLRITPVDPTSPLRGDYATFNYDISTLQSYSFRNGSTPRNGEMVYVTLRPLGKYWAVKEASLNKPLTNDDIFIKGKVLSGGRVSNDHFSYPNEFGSATYRIAYGIEEYFIPEGKGRNFSFFQKNSAASVIIDDEGNAALKKIYVDDKPWP